MKNEVISILSANIKSIFTSLKIDYDKLQEIRLRNCKPLMILYNSEEYFVYTDGRFMHEIGKEMYMVSGIDIKETIEYVSNYSLYAYEDELRQGFITIGGGHRVGITGKVVLKDNNIHTIKNISGINIRIAHEIKGCSRKYLKYLSDENGIYSTLIISPPGCGKTTFLRDLIYQISSGNCECGGMNVGVVDERSEIGASYKGVCGNDLGIRTDVIDCCPKSIGMLLLLRSMSPKVIAVDEIGNENDIAAIEYVANSGCKLVCTIHGNDLESLMEKKHIKEFLKKGVFERFIVLKGKRVVQIYDRNFVKILDKVSWKGGCND